MVNGYSGCINDLNIMNKAGMNMSIQISLPGYDFNSSGCIPRGRIAGSYGSKIFICLFLKEISPGRTDDEVGTPILWPPDAQS